jgi:hypothetical protein
LFEAFEQTLRTSVRHTVERIAIPPNFSGHIDRRIELEQRNRARSACFFFLDHRDEHQLAQ